MSVTLAVLAGGSGRRMGVPKDLLLADGRPVLAALLDRIAWEGPTLLVAPHDGRLPPGHDDFDRVVNDSRAGQGPLRGILTALTGAGTDEIVIIPVDMPSLRREHLVWVGTQLAERPQASGIMLRRAGADTPVEPFPSAFRLAAASIIRQRLEAGLFTVHEVCEQPDFQCLPAPSAWDSDVWRNVNTPQELPPGWTRA